MRKHHAHQRICGSKKKKKPQRVSQTRQLICISVAVFKLLAVSAADCPRQPKELMDKITAGENIAIVDLRQSMGDRKKD